MSTWKAAEIAIQPQGTDGAVVGAADYEVDAVAELESADIAFHGMGAQGAYGRGVVRPTGARHVHPKFGECGRGGEEGSHER